MDDLVFKLADEEIPRDRLALLLEHFSKLSDERESWRVMYPLAEVLLLLNCRGAQNRGTCCSVGWVVDKSCDLHSPCHRVRSEGRVLHVLTWAISAAFWSRAQLIAENLRLEERKNVAVMLRAYRRDAIRRGCSPQ